MNIEPRPEPGTRTRNLEPGTWNCSRLSLRQQDLGDACRELAPGGGFRCELRAALTRQAIQLRPPAELGLTPLSLEPSPSLHAIERWIQGPFLDDDRLLGGVLDELRNGVAVPGTPSQGLQDQGV